MLVLTTAGNTFLPCWTQINVPTSNL